jgi:mono/diheme cytochrome c family protein
MMATLLAFGVTQAELEAREETFKDVREYLLSLEPPAWPFAPPSAEAVARGREVFEVTCARCHGTSACEANESELVPLSEVATDPVRAQSYGPDEVAWVNSGWLAQDYPETASGGAYVAPPLRGVWATAPYFHNGSVPTLAAVLESSTRPKFFELEAGADDYDSVAVGRKFRVHAAAPASPPREQQSHVYDTTQPGLSNGGHTFGDSLSTAERADLIEFLKQY